MSNSARHRITPQRGRRIQAGAKVPATGSYIRQSAEGAADRNHSVALLGLPCGCILLQGLHPCLCSDTPSGLFRTTRDTQSPPLALPARGGETTPCHLFRFKGRVFACQIPRNTGHTTSCHFRNLTSKFPTRDVYCSRSTWLAVGSLLVKDRMARDTQQEKPRPLFPPLGEGRGGGFFFFCTLHFALCNKG